jgi:hypothetical protein
MDKENGNRKRSTKGNVATERVQMGRSSGKKRKEKRKSDQGINNKGEIGDLKKAPRKRIERKVHIGNKWWKIMPIYSKEMKITRRRVEDAMKENREDRILLGGDFNGRIGEKGARNWEEERGVGKRKSKDKVENAQGKRLMEWIEENVWEVLNGNKQGDKEG